MTGNRISEQGEKVIANFIQMLKTEEDLKHKTVKEDGGDLKHSRKLRIHLVKLF